MKKIEIHPFSAALGAAALALVAVVAGAQSLHHPTRGVVTIAGIPTPHQMMRVQEATPFTVPAGKLFVVTGLADSAFGPEVDMNLRVNGQIVFWQRTTSGNVVTEVPPGFTVPAGDMVYAHSNHGGEAIVFGYLVDA